MGQGNTRLVAFFLLSIFLGNIHFGLADEKPIPPPVTSSDAHAPEPLRPYGYDFFKAAYPATQVEPEAKRGLSVPASYLLDVGDDLKIVVSSSIGHDSEFDATVNSDDNVYVPNLGLINVAGMTFKDLENTIQNELSSHYKRTFRVMVSLSRIHAIQVYVTGEGLRPGSYVVSGLATPIDALYAAGGPSLKGSMRDIAIIRQNHVLAHVDLYEYLMKGKIEPISLQSNDTLLIAPQGRMVGVMGEVLKPALYELKDPETLDDLIRFSGGVLPTGYASRARIDRVIDGEKRIVVDADLRHDQQVAMSAGDMVTIFSVLPEILNSVSIEGGVKRPGLYGYRPGMKVIDLIQLSQGFSEAPYLEKADIHRKMINHSIRIISINLQEALNLDPSQNVDLAPEDLLTIYSLKQATFQKKQVAIRGAVAKPGEYDRLEDMTVRDLVIMAGGLSPEAAAGAELARVENGQTHVIPLNIKDIVNHKPGTIDTMLQDLDTVYIKGTAGYHLWSRTITLKGEVVHPGDYPITEDVNTLSKFIEKAGGLTQNAFPEGAFLIRQNEKIADPALLQMAQGIQDYTQQIAEQMTRLEIIKQSMQIAPPVAAVEKTPSGLSSGFTSTPVFVSSGGNLGPIGGATVFGNQASLTPETGGNNVFVRKVREILANGRVPINLPKIIVHSENEDVALVDGDVLYIPPKPTTVIVSGGVYSPSAQIYRKGENVGYYLARSGGVGPDGDSGHILIIHASGEAIKGSGGSAVLLGDIIFVPTKALHLGKNGWDIFNDFIRAVTSGLVLNQLLR